MLWIGIETRLVLAGVFGLSAFGKLRSTAAFAAFREAVAHLGRVPARYLKPAAITLVVLEALSAGGLLLAGTALAALALIPCCWPCSPSLWRVRSAGSRRLVRRASGRRIVR